MNHLRQVLLGILAALLSASIVLGSFSLALTEGGERIALLPSPVMTETVPLVVNPPVIPSARVATLEVMPSATETTGTPKIETATLTLSPTLTPSPTVTHTATPPTACPEPGGWITLQVQPGDSLKSLAEKYNSTEDALMQANCLIIDNLIPGTLIYVPGLPPTSQPTLCVRPSGWVAYIVRYRETLFGLSRELGMSVEQLQQGNCMGESILIKTGQVLWVPYLPSRPTLPSSTPTPLPASPTSEPSTPTMTPLTPTLTATPRTPTPTSTIPPTPSPAPTEPPPPPTATSPPPTEAPTATDIPVTEEPVLVTEEPPVSPEP